ncbi:MAG: hypothetical protein J7L21_06775 [Sulfurimonas sp.]|nr:hypothetical protein [Sulfurimonas sp.]
MSLFLFKKKSSTLNLADSEVFDNLKEVCRENSLLVYQNLTIYHHSINFFIPLLILDPVRGIYLFEYKTWNYDKLKNATAQKSQNQETSNETLAFDKTHAIIKQKFNELTHNDGVAIFNFLLMENLSVQNYEHLDVSLKELLPKNRIILSDSSKEEILNNLHDVEKPENPLPDVAHIMGNLLIQYLVISDDDSLHLANSQQMDFIESEPKKYQTLSGENSSGKTEALLLKAILYKLKNPNKKVIIIEPTTLACDILKHKLIRSVEHAIIVLDITSIEIITPIVLLNRHLSKHNKLLLDKTIYIDQILMKKKFQIADLIICDDSDLLPEEFTLYLKHIQKKSNLILVSNKQISEADFVFEKSFCNNNTNIKFIKTNPHAKALQIIEKLLKDFDAKDILVISDELSKKQLGDDLEFFIKDKTVLLDSSRNLIDQDLDNLLLSTYSQISGITAKYVILLGISLASIQELNYAVNSSKDSVYILYEDECEKLSMLKEKFEKNKEIL